LIGIGRVGHVLTHIHCGGHGKLVDCLKSKGRHETEEAKRHDVLNAILEMATHVTAKQSHNAGR
jgi:hypothetical protein